MITKYLRLGLVFFLMLGFLATASPVKAGVTPWPIDGFWSDPVDANIYDWMYFGLYEDTPTTWSCHWDFGDGTTYDYCFVEHAKQYAADGDYTVSVEVTNDLGEVSSASRVVSIRTHDVAITRFNAPQTAKVGQTRQLVVYVRNSLYAEIVKVDLYKSTPNGFEWFGSLEQSVPVRTENRTTAFSFNYTFTADDARMGKITFLAEATLQNGIRDALPADNEAKTLPIRITR